MGATEFGFIIAMVCLIVLSLAQIGSRGQTAIIAIGILQTCFIMLMFSLVVFVTIGETFDPIILLRILTISAFLAIVNTCFWRRQRCIPKMNCECSVPTPLFARSDHSEIHVIHHDLLLPLMSLDSRNNCDINTD